MPRLQAPTLCQLVPMRTAEKRSASVAGRALVGRTSGHGEAAHPLSSIGSDLHDVKWRRYRSQRDLVCVPSADGLERVQQRHLKGGLGSVGYAAWSQ